MNNNNKEYTYYMRLRPPSIGTQPRGTTNINSESITINGYQYHGSVTYNRELTQNEIYDYDLDYIEA